MSTISPEGVVCQACARKPNMANEWDTNGWVWRLGVIMCGDCRRYCSIKDDPKKEFKLWPYNEFWGIDHFEGDKTEVAKSVKILAEKNVPESGTAESPTHFISEDGSVIVPFNLTRNDSFLTILNSLFK